MSGGNTGKVLFVDLTRKKITLEEPEPSLYEDFLGGYGLGARVIYSRTDAKINPLGPENMLGFTTGPLVGTPALTGCRFTVCGKSPLTGTWGDSNCGGYFGPALKMAGYDAVFFSGTASEPVYLWIDNGKAELRSAKDLWGLDTFATEDVLRARHGERVQVASIGPAGEKLSLIAAVMNDKGRAAGRSGLGAVMGSKKLKAVAVLGTEPVPLAREDEARKIRQQYLKELDRDDIRHFRKYGTIDHVASSAMSNDSPVKNWKGVGVRDFPAADKISDDAILRYEIKKYACWQCPIACGGLYRVPGGPYAVEETHKPEYETCAMFGNNLLNDNLESIIKMNDLCNRYGLDTISTGATIGYALECYEAGLIDKKDTGGLELTWGNHAAIVTLTEMIAKREVFGDVLADGVVRAVERIGADSARFAVHVGGQELPAHDPKYAPSWGLYYQVDATPGRHTQLGLVPYDLGRAYRGLELDRKVEKYVYEGKGELAASVQDLLHAFYCTGVCMFAVQRINVNAWPEFLTAVTGKEYDLESLRRIGARVAALRQAFNIREGVEISKIQLTGRALGDPPLDGGPLEGITLDMPTMVKGYYTARGWDPRTGYPTAQALRALGLEDIAKDLAGILSEG